MSEGEIGLFEAIYTQRAIRSYKPDTVPEELTGRVIEGVADVPDDVSPAALCPLGWPDKMRYGPTTRKPWREVTHWDTRGNLEV